MAKILDKTIDQRDRYYKEGQRQNGLVKELLKQNTQLRLQKEEMEQKLNAVEEARLNHKELYDIAAEEASEAVTAQQALERIIEHMEAEKVPQTLRLAELHDALQAKQEAMKLLEKSYQEVSNDRQAINTLLSLSKV